MFQSPSTLHLQPSTFNPPPSTCAKRTHPPSTFNLPPYPDCLAGRSDVVDAEN